MTTKSTPGGRPPVAPGRADRGGRTGRRGEAPAPGVPGLQPRRPRRRWLPTWRGLLFAIGLLAVLGATGFGMAYAMTPIPDVNPETQAQTTTVYYADGRTELGSFGVNRTNVELERVPEHLRQAVLAAEDREFYSNRGISPRGIGRALVNNLRGESTQGGSTITQQYVKNAHLTSERTYARKSREVLIALKVDRQLSKDQILESYLNTIYWGRGAYGVQAAADEYFGKDVSKLSVAESAYLAGIIQSPGRYDPRKNREGAQRRWAYVLDGMVASGWLSPAQRAKQDFPQVDRVSRQQRLSGPKGYLLTAVRDELETRGFEQEEIDASGLRVVTTFDRRAQEAAQQAMAEGFPSSKAAGVHAGLAAVRPGDGAVVAMYGGRDYLDREFNDAVQARKQAGSTFKAFTLAAALEEGIGLDSRWQGDSPIVVPDTTRRTTQIANEFDRDYGSVDLRTATEQSINTAFVDLTLELGPKRVVDAIEDAGLDGGRAVGLQPGPAVTLGTAAVSPVDLAAAYSTFAAEGKRSSWHLISQVKDPDGETLYRAQKEVGTAFPADVAADVTDALRVVVDGREGTGGAARALGRPVAGKTGTHADRTAWFVGYTPQLSAAVAFYREGRNGEELSLDGVGGRDPFFGGGYPAEIWTAFARGALEGEPVQQFPAPAGIGQTAAPEPSATVTAPGTAPGTTPGTPPGAVPAPGGVLLPPENVGTPSRPVPGPRTTLAPPTSTATTRPPLTTGPSGGRTTARSTAPPATRAGGAGEPGSGGRQTVQQLQQADQAPESTASSTSSASSTEGSRTQRSTIRRSGPPAGERRSTATAGPDATGSSGSGSSESGSAGSSGASRDARGSATGTGTSSPTGSARAGSEASSPTRR